MNAEKQLGKQVRKYFEKRFCIADLVIEIAFPENFLSKFIFFDIDNFRAVREEFESVYMMLGSIEKYIVSLVS